jgi:hypothetical protein
MAGLVTDPARWDLVLAPAQHPGAARRWIDLSSGVVGSGPIPSLAPVLVERA